MLRTDFGVGDVPVMYAVLHPPNFYAQAAAQARPELRKKAFALLDGDSTSETVFAANKARVAGIEVGMARLQAEAFPEAVTLRRVTEQEQAANAALRQRRSSCRR